MDPDDNPFTPGAGTPPPELAGRDAIVASAGSAIRRTQRGLSARSRLLLGLRGVGKTVLLSRMSEIAEESGFVRIEIEAPENGRLARTLIPELRRALQALSRVERSADRARRALAALRGFASVFRISYGDLEIGVTNGDDAADSGNLEADLPILLRSAAEAAKAAGRPMALFIDEVQYLSKEDLSALITALHRLNQRQMPFLCFGAGLPQVAALAGEAKSYAERLFEYVRLGALDQAASADAVTVPIRRRNLDITGEAMRELSARAQGYPYFLQEWGAHTWNVAKSTPIQRQDVIAATSHVLRNLDEGFYSIRCERLPPREQRYLRAMAELGSGPHRSRAIAEELGQAVNAAAATRDSLIKRGMVYSPRYGETAFTVPMFDDYMRRQMPQWKGVHRSRTRER